ncbi:MAG: phosphoribosylamine--glycine ligase [candidate division WOR-3 bacterium]|nr:phosphoribosylamine--glycine ligase [candidate division WOR-3 bacterium]MCX7836677.1 phosphoribosylamine--glycine ligase [candidate division WOR-3 bacterium]MDW8113682.1 phosphoribosylamine--glycine ligase [candidate division WOR-3 bacterium]
MKILVVGGGGREHTLVWKLKKSPLVKEIYCAPGNGGISEIAEIVNISSEDLKGILNFCQEKKIDLVVVGPELPLSLGITDLLEENNIKVFGPNKKASLLEASKVFAKEFMKKYEIPTADFETFDKESIKNAKDYALSLLEKDGFCVIKADGLCFGKGSFVINEKEEAFRIIEDLMVRETLGKAGEKIVIEKCLFGYEASLISITDGEKFLSFLPSQDHKRLLDNDEGPNTGGMGAYSPLPFLTEDLLKKAKEKIFERLLFGLKEEKIEYCGVIYAGVMINKEEIFVLEFNVRFGDPETQVILPLLKSDLLENILLAKDKKLKEGLEFFDKSCLCVVLASKGYPYQYEKGKKIELPREIDEEKNLLFHSGTEKKNNEFYTKGGRVLSVCGIGKDLKEAKDNAYSLIENIYFEGMHFRKDIGKKGIEYYEKKNKTSSTL